MWKDLPEVDRLKLTFGLENLDWDAYWLSHVNGLIKNVMKVDPIALG